MIDKAQDGGRRDEGGPMQPETPGKQGFEVHDGALAREHQSDPGIDAAGKQKRNEGRFDHAADVAVDIGLRDGSDQEGARGNRRAAVAEEGTGQHCAAGKQRGDAHRGPDRRTDDAHGGGRPEGGSRQHGDQAVEEKGHQKEDGRPDQAGGIADDDGDRPRSPPERRHDPDQEEGDEDVADGPDPFEGHAEKFAPRKAFAPAVKQKDEQAEGEGVQDRQIQYDADK